MSQLPYCTAVWKEGTRTVEDHVARSWINFSTNILRYPRKPDKPILDMIREQIKPNDTWLSYPLVKVKRSRGA